MPTLVSIAITPNPANIPGSGSLPFTAIGTYSDSSTANITGSATWTSSQPTLGSIDVSGVATGVSFGNTIITASLSGIIGQTILTIGPTSPFKENDFERLEQAEAYNQRGIVGYKPAIGDTFNPGAVEAAWKEVSPLITPDWIKKHMLFGIPLVSGIADPATGKAQRMDDEIIKEHIDRAIGTAEVETDLSIMPKTIVEKHPFDKNLYDSFNFISLRQRPASALLSLKIVSSDNKDVFVYPIEWIDVGQLQYGQINTIPLGQAVGNAGFIPSGPANSAFFINMLAQRAWIPSWNQVTYRTGFHNGLLPREINELIGTIAAIDILGELAATYSRSTSKSIGIDGLSQSVSGPGQAMFDTRIKKLEEKRKLITGRIRARFGVSFASDNV